MSGPPPPPPPPGPPPPSIGGGGGGGQPAFLADIRKGAQLKKVPDSLKNDRSAALVCKSTYMCHFSSIIQLALGCRYF